MSRSNYRNGSGPEKKCKGTKEKRDFELGIVLTESQRLPGGKRARDAVAPFIGGENAIAGKTDTW